MVDVTEILQHWYAGRPKVEVARSLGVDAKTVRRYVAPAEAAGMAPGGPPVSEEQWRALARDWFPQLAGTGIRQVSWREIAVHHDRIAGLLPVVPVSVIHQRLADEQGLTASVASLRRHVRAHFPGEVRAGQVRPPRPPSPPGAEAQVDYGYLGLWPDPATGRRRRVRAFSMVLPYSRHLFIRPAVSMTQRAWTEAHAAAFEFFGGAPLKLTPDNLKAGVCKPDLYDPKINRGYAELARHYGCLVDPARAYHPRDKPRVAYCTSSERWAARWRSCRSQGVVPASLVEDRRVGSGRVVEDFAFVVIPLAADNSGVVPVFDGCGGHAEPPGHLDERDQPGVEQPLAAAA